jgi:hypothetical protein
MKICTKCGAKWLEGQLYWSNGKPGKDEDLAGLVCDPHGNEECVNEMKGKPHNGQTWEKRMGFIEGLEYEMKRQQDKLKEQ